MYQKDPCVFFEEALSFRPDRWQADVARDVARHRRVTVRSGQGVGKTGLQAALVLWFLCCFPYSRVVATAPTRQQLHDVLWAEIAKWQARSPILPGLLKWTKTYVRMIGAEKRWFAVARTAAKPENMQGFHEDNMLFVVDEASGVPEPVMEAVLGTLSGANNKLLLCGNPTRTDGAFYDSHHKDRQLYCCHKVSALDSHRTSRETIEANIQKYGKESNFARVRVFGEFPQQEDDVFIPLAWLEASVRYVESKHPPSADGTLFSKEGKKGAVESIHIGCDVARYGDDKTILGFKVNERLAFYKKRRGQDTMRTAADIVLLGEKLREKHKFPGKIPIKVDDGGVGGGVIDRLRQIKQGDPGQYGWMEITPVAFGQVIRHKYYHDSTTYMMAVVKELLSPLDENGAPKDIELILPDDNDLVGQLSTRKYFLNERNKMVVESKKAMKKRGLPSPDEADCVLLCCLPVRTTKR